MNEKSKRTFLVTRYTTEGNALSLAHHSPFLLLRDLDKAFFAFSFFVCHCFSPLQPLSFCLDPYSAKISSKSFFDQYQIQCILGRLPKTCKQHTFFTFNFPLDKISVKWKEDLSFHLHILC